MNATASGFVRDQSAIDREHLRLLSIFHFVAAGLACVGLLFVAGHYAIFHFVFSNPDFWANAPKGAGPPPAFFLAMFHWLYAVFGTWFAVSGLVNILSGVFLRRLRHRTFCLAVGALNCLHLPLGTILGVFTFIVLTRESVAKAYAEQSQV